MDTAGYDCRLAALASGSAGIFGMKFVLSGTTILDGRERRKGEKLRLLLLDLAPGSGSVGISGISFALLGTTMLEGRERRNGEKLLLLRLLDASECRF